MVDKNIPSRPLVCAVLGRTLSSVSSYFEGIHIVPSPSLPVAAAAVLLLSLCSWKSSLLLEAGIH